MLPLNEFYLNYAVIDRDIILRLSFNRINKNLFLLIILCLYNVVVRAQGNHALLDGYVSYNNAPAIAVTVYLLKRTDSSIVKFSITDNTGHFKYENITAGTYLIRATAIGFKKVISGPYILQPGQHVTIETIKLQKAINTLGGVTVTDKRRFIEVTAGKTVLNLQNSMLATGHNALDVLKSSPGVQIDESGNFVLNGRGGVTLMIDGKRTYLSGEALTDLLQSTQSNMIDQIELISNPSVRTDAEGTGGIINIKLKKDKSLGTNATFTAGLGLMQPGESHTSGLKWNTGLTFNNRTKKLNVFGSYNYSYGPADRIMITTRAVNYNKSDLLVASDYFSNQSVGSHNYRLGADYNLSAKHIIGFLVSGTVSNSDNNKNTVTALTGVQTPSKVDSNIISYSHVAKTISNIALDLNYRGSFDNLGELAVDADYAAFNRHPLENILSKYYYPGATDPYRSLDLHNYYQTRYDIYALNIDYKVSLNKTSSINAVAKSSYLKSANNTDFSSFINNGYQLNPIVSGQFNYTENVNALALIYTKEFSKTTNMQAGLRAEQTVTTGAGKSVTDSSTVNRNNYVDFFPSLQLSHKLNDDNQLLFSYARRIRRPSYEDLNPFIAYQDEFNFNMGNIELQPQYAHNFELTHTYKNKYTTTLRASLVSNFIFTTYLPNNVITSKVNLGNRYIYGVQFNVPADITKWWSANLNIDASYQQYTYAPVNAPSLNIGGQDVLINLTQDFVLPAGLKAQIISTYETPTTFGYSRYKSAYDINVGLSKSVLNKLGTLQLQVNDVFNSEKDRYTSDYQNLNITGYLRTGFRVYQVNFTYLLGNKSIKAARRRLTGFEPEQGRVPKD
jgi:iron complex outermembrane receptor protein